MPATRGGYGRVMALPCSGEIRGWAERTCALVVVPRTTAAIDVGGYDGRAHRELSARPDYRHLREALDAVDLFEEALLQAIGDRSPTGLQIAAFATVAGLRRKHNRGPAAPPSPGTA